MKQKLKVLMKQVLMREPLIEKDCRVPLVWAGSKYGGFYINPEKLDSEGIVYSFWVGEDITFDEYLIRKFGCRIFAFDPTPKVIEWLSERNLDNRFIFSPVGLGMEDGDIDFHFPENPNHVSTSVFSISNDKIKLPVKHFGSILETLNHSRIDVLKMDIEGMEYNVMKDILDTNVVIEQIALEVHHHVTAIPDGLNKTKKLISDIRNAGYELTGISDSNHEITFQRKVNQTFR